MWEVDAESARRVGHPAPFPLELPRKLIELYTYKGDLVLDPFMGSGTTLVAAVRTGRLPVGYDTDADYVELARRRVTAEIERVEQGPGLYHPVRGVQDPLPLGDLPHEERQEHFQARAVSEGKKAQDIALKVLQEAGFVVEENPKVPGIGLQYNFLVTSEDGARQWYVDVSGAFTTVRPGLMRTDTLWKMLGRVHVLAAGRHQGNEGDGPDSGVLVLTSNLPRAGSEGDQGAAQRSAPTAVFDAVEMFDDDDTPGGGRYRLRSYASKPASMRRSPASGSGRRHRADRIRGDDAADEVGGRCLLRGRPRRAATGLPRRPTSTPCSVCSPSRSWSRHSIPRGLGDDDSVDELAQVAARRALGR